MSRYLLVDPPFPLVLVQLMDAAELLPVEDLQLLGVYVQQLLQESQHKVKYKWHHEARVALELGMNIPDIDQVTAAQLRKLRNAYVAEHGGDLAACRAVAVPLVEELERLNLRAFELP